MRDRTVKKLGQRPDEQKISELEVPQPFAIGKHSSPALKALLLDDRMEDLKGSIKKIAASISGCEVENIHELIPSSQASKLAGISRKKGFMLVDQAAMDRGEHDRACLVSIFITKASGGKDLLVPIVIPHKHPDGWGREIQKAVYQNFIERYGEHPRELVKGWVAKKVRGTMHSIYEYRRWFGGAAAGLLLLTGGIIKGPGLVNELSEYRKEAAEKREAAKELARAQVIEKFEKKAEAFEKGILSEDDLSKTLSQEELHDLLEILPSCGIQDKKRVLSVLNLIKKPAARIDGQFRHYGGCIERAVLELIVNEADNEIRHQAADLMREYKRLE